MLHNQMSQLRLTNIISILPYFLVVNNTDQSLRFMEVGTAADLWHDLEAQQVNWSFSFNIERCNAPINHGYNNLNHGKVSMSVIYNVLPTVSTVSQCTCTPVLYVPTSFQMCCTGVYVGVTKSHKCVRNC